MTVVFGRFVVSILRVRHAGFGVATLLVAGCASSGANVHRAWDGSPAAPKTFSESNPKPDRMNPTDRVNTPSTAAAITACNAEYAAINCENAFSGSDPDSPNFDPRIEQIAITDCETEARANYRTCILEADEAEYRRLFPPDVPDIAHVICEGDQQCLERKEDCTEDYKARDCQPLGAHLPDSEVESCETNAKMYYVLCICSNATDADGAKFAQCASSLGSPQLGD